MSRKKWLRAHSFRMQHHLTLYHLIGKKESLSWVSKWMLQKYSSFLQRFVAYETKENNDLLQRDCEPRPHALGFLASVSPSARPVAPPWQPLLVYFSQLQVMSDRLSRHRQGKRINRINSIWRKRISCRPVGYLLVIFKFEWLIPHLSVGLCGGRSCFSLDLCNWHCWRYLGRLYRIEVSRLPSNFTWHSLWAFCIRHLYHTSLHICRVRPAIGIMHVCLCSFSVFWFLSLLAYF